MKRVIIFLAVEDFYRFMFQSPHQGLSKKELSNRIDELGSKITPDTTGPLAEEYSSLIVERERRAQRVKYWLTAGMILSIVFFLFAFRRTVDRRDPVRVRKEKARKKLEKRRAKEFAASPRSRDVEAIDLGGKEEESRDGRPDNS